MNAAGQISDAVTSGSATVSHFLIAPNDKVYVVFSSRVDLANTSSWASYSSGCLLAEVDPSSGVPTCVDSSLMSINWPTYGAAYDHSAPIQFDGSGAIYYSGYSNGTAVLRKYLNGVSTNLVTDNVQLEHFLVMNDGSVFVSGRTNSTNATWTRRISPSGSLETVAPVDSHFLSLFPDNNVYMGFWSGNSYSGVARYLTGSDQLEPKYWIGSTAWGETDYFDGPTICSNANLVGQDPFCGSYGSVISWSYNSGDGNEFVNANGAAMQYYPTVRFLPTQVTNVTVAQGVIDDLVLAGLDSNGKNILTLYNTTNDTEKQLIGPGNEIEIYHLNYVANGNKVLFDGLRFSDNSYVIGEIDLSTDQVSVVANSGQKLADLQAFG